MTATFNSNATVPEEVTNGVVALGTIARQSSKSSPSVVNKILAGKRIVIDESLPGNPHLSVDIETCEESNFYNPDNKQRSIALDELIKFLDYKFGHEIIATIDPGGTPDHRGTLPNVSWLENHGGVAGKNRFTFTGELSGIGQDRYIVIVNNLHPSLSFKVNKQSNYFEISTYNSSDNTPVSGKFDLFFKRVNR